MLHSKKMMLKIFIFAGQDRNRRRSGRSAGSSHCDVNAENHSTPHSDWRPSTTATITNRLWPRRKLRSESFLVWKNGECQMFDLLYFFKQDVLLVTNLQICIFKVKNGIPCSRLQLQHRMRPRIADLLRPHIYDDLRDHASVEKYDHVVGLQKNIFFLSHRNQEKAVRDGMSKVWAPWFNFNPQLIFFSNEICTSLWISWISIF